MLLPVVLVFMVRLVNDRAIMGTFVNGPAYNAVVWFTATVLVALTILMIVTSFLAAGPGA